MKTKHKIKLGGKNLNLSLSFGASLALVDELASPTLILQDTVGASQAKKEGKRYDAEFALNERTAVQILEIGNRSFENLTFEELGELAFKEGIMNTYAMVLDYIMEMTDSHSELNEDQVLAPEGPSKADAGN